MENGDAKRSAEANGPLKAAITTALLQLITELVKLDRAIARSK